MVMKLKKPFAAIGKTIHAAFKKVTSISHVTPVAIVIFLLSGALAFGFFQIYTLQTKVSSLSQNLDTLTLALATTSEEFTKVLDDAQNSLTVALAEEKQKTSAIQQQLGNFQNEVGTISGTVGNLQKLSKTDPELLQKYSKVFFLNEHYEPARLTEIPNQYEYNEDRHSKIHASVWPQLQFLLEKAKRENIELYVFSAFRPFSEQEALKSQYRVTYGEGTANKFSADQGYSEHQLGTTVDLITTGIGGTLDGFGSTGAYQWLLQNAHLFGFTLSYPEGNDSYIFEPWHWRYVGVKLATDLHNTNRNLYDLEQREIDEYLLHLFD